LALCIREEKELFEKFWRGTFQAVTKPRPGSVIMASITSRRRVAAAVVINGDLDVPRSPSYSLSPPRKKKKSKKSSKRSKRHRGLRFYFSVSLQILPLQFGDKILDAKGNHGHHDYDSGNDTSSPPSNKNSISQPSGIVDSSKQCQGLASPDKLKITERDNASDSGNSVTSYASLCNPLTESSTFYDGTSKALSVEGEDVRPRKRKRSKLKRSRSSRRRRRERSVRRSPSRNFSCGSSTHTGHSSRSRSLSFCRYMFCHVKLFRPRDRKRSSNYKEKNRKRRNKERRRKSRRKSYSPMRKRRRDSPSHLEARRITSARKRPIPYFRPSPSSSCRSTSVSSWSSIFTRGRSLTSGHCYRSNSRSSSWNSIFGTRSSRSRSPSYVRLKKSSKTRR
uniref:Serine/arginine repetitive matrix 4 n=1 Tax=Gadus morhua TaxID=8049 RepID=A0A8C5FDC8_GADMO